jgi:putative ABC transport system permease protein
MYFRTIRNDILRNKAISFTIMVFVAVAAMLLSLAAILVVNLSGAMDNLMTQARTPHFLQMHSGVIEESRLEAFAEARTDVVEHQVVEFLNINGVNIVIAGRSLADSIQDNGISVQNDRFDHLLDFDGRLVYPSNGQIYVPIPYMQQGLAEVGDEVRVAGEEFVVAGFLRDSMMNSLLSSSKRFLVSEADYAALRDSGSVEYLIEFRLDDLASIGDFETAYVAAGLEANGPTITYPQFRTLNGLSDGLLIAVILLISVLVVAIAFLCIRFTLLARIEDDYREIGVMKAIGLRVSDVRRLYLAKYAAIAAAGSVAGFVLSFAFRGVLLENIRLYMGESERTAEAVAFGGAGVVIIFSVIVVYVSRVLRRFRKISPVEAIRFGAAQDQAAGARRLRLSTNRLLATNAFLGIKDVLARKKIYATMLVVVVISAFIIIVPQNLHNTISSSDFITHMGIGLSDLRIDIQQTTDIGEKAEQVAAAMSEDESIATFVVLTTKTFTARLDDGSEERIKVELGDHTVLPLSYSEGSAPTSDNEIALSRILAADLDKGEGDVLSVLIEGRERDLRVSGIYSDVTNGGKTAKAAFSSPSADTMWSVVSARVSDVTSIDDTIDAYGQRFEFAKVSDIGEYVTQTYGSTIDSIGMASYASFGVALATALLITLLFTRMLVAKDRHSIAVMKALGFNSSDIRAQYFARSVFILLIGVLVGAVSANTLGEMLAGRVIGSLGGSSFSFSVNPIAAYVIAPMLMMLAVLTATAAGTRGVGNIRISEDIRE